MRACLRQQGSVILQRLTAQLKLCPSERLREKRYFGRFSRFAGCALALRQAQGRVELFIFKSLAARMNPCPDNPRASTRETGFHFMATVGFFRSLFLLVR